MASSSVAYRARSVCPPRAGPSFVLWTARIPLYPIEASLHITTSSCPIAASEQPHQVTREKVHDCPRAPLCDHDSLISEVPLINLGGLRVAKGAPPDNPDVNCIRQVVDLHRLCVTIMAVLAAISFAIELN